MKTTTPSPTSPVRSPARLAVLSCVPAALFLTGCLADHLGYANDRWGQPSLIHTAFRDTFLTVAYAPMSMAVPIPSFSSEVQSGRQIDEDSMIQIRPDETSRAEVVSKLGNPWMEYPDLKVMVYYWEKRKGYLLRGPIPIIPADEVSEFTYFLVRLNARGQVAAHTMAKGGETDDIRKIASDWVDALWVEGVIRYRTFEPELSSQRPGDLVEAPQGLR